MDEIISFASKWLELEDIKVSEINQTDTTCSLLYVEDKIKRANRNKEKHATCSAGVIQ